MQIYDYKTELLENSICNEPQSNIKDIIISIAVIIFACSVCLFTLLHI